MNGLECNVEMKGELLFPSPLPLQGGKYNVKFDSWETLLSITQPLLSITLFRN